jgi:type II restriction enzyme
MLDAVRSDRTPNLLAVQYSSTFAIVNLFIVPRYFITENVVERRPPLSMNARRAGWVGCNILLNRIPPDGRILAIREGVPVESAEVQRLFLRAKQLKELPPTKRGWTVDVLNAIRSLDKSTFSLADLYRVESRFATLHPNNQNIRPKIRQQLQVLRDLGFLTFAAPGQYQIVSTVDTHA